MSIFSTSNLKTQSNKRFLMKQEQIKLTLRKLLHNNQIKWYTPSNDKYSKLINITNVVLTKDLNTAIVYVNLYSYSSKDEVNLADIIKNLNTESILLRRYLTKELKLRRTPNIIFKQHTDKLDTSQIEHILDNIKYTTD